MDLAVPFVFMFYATQFAGQVNFFDDKYVELHFSLEHLNLLRKRQTRLLKPIQSSFYHD